MTEEAHLMYVLDPNVTDGAVNNVFPQVVGMGDDYSWDAPDSVRNLPAFAPAHVQPNLSAFHLDPHTNVTDVLSQALIKAPGWLLSNRLRADIDPFAIQPHTWYKAAVVHRGRRLFYNWLHLTATIESGIDFARSTFVVRENERDTITRFGSESELLLKCRELANEPAGPLRVRAIVFLPGIALLDLFVLRLAGPTYFLSDQLVTRLREGEYSGFRVTSSDALFVARATAS